MPCHAAISLLVAFSAMRSRSVGACADKWSCALTFDEINGLVGCLCAPSGDCARHEAVGARACPPPHSFRRAHQTQKKSTLVVANGTDTLTSVVARLRDERRSVALVVDSAHPVRVPYGAR